MDNANGAGGAASARTLVELIAVDPLKGCPVGHRLFFPSVLQEWQYPYSCVRVLTGDRHIQHSIWLPIHQALVAVPYLPDREQLRLGAGVIA